MNVKKVYENLNNKDLIRKFIKKFVEINENKFEYYYEKNDEKIILNIIKDIINENNDVEIEFIENKIKTILYNSIENNDELYKIYQGMI